MLNRSRMVQLLSDHPTMTYQEIGEIAGCSRQRVHQIAQESGLTRKNYRYRTDITVDRVLALYYDSTLFHYDMCRILGCTIRTMALRLRMAGISPSAAHSRKGEAVLAGKASRPGGREIVVAGLCFTGRLSSVKWPYRFLTSARQSI